MATGKVDCFLDSSVLINFLNVDRADLLGSHPTLRFVITPHVQAEVTQHFPLQQQRLRSAIERDWIRVAEVSGAQELAVFRTMLNRNLGAGESAIIAAAAVRAAPIAIDDAKARREALALKAGITAHSTSDLLLDHIRAGTLTVEAGDGIKGDLETLYRFRMPGFESFTELLPPTS